MPSDKNPSTTDLRALLGLVGSTGDRILWSQPQSPDSWCVDPFVQEAIPFHTRLSADGVLVITLIDPEEPYAD